MKEPKLTYRLKKLPDGLEFQVLQMREEYRGMDDFEAENGFFISSEGLPEIDPLVEVIYLRGSAEECDMEISDVRYLNVDERDQYYDKINEALKEWAGSVG